MYKHFSMLVLLAFASLLMGYAPNENNNTYRPSYAPDLIKIKLSAEGSSRAQLPIGLNSESKNFNLNELDQLLSRNGGTKIIRAHRQVNDAVWQSQTGFDRWLLIKLDGSTSVEDAIKSFKANRYVEDATPEYYVYTTAVPNDTYYANNWGHNNTAQLPGSVDANGNHIGAGVGTLGYDSDVQLAWDQAQGYGSASIVIAIIDTGVDTTHPDLRLVPGYDFGSNDSNPMDDSAEKGHGTACAGIAAARANNALGITGVAGGCSVMPLKVADAAGNMSFTSIANAITYAADNGARIISMSLGAEDGAGEGSSPATDAAITYADNKGVVIFAATANSNASAIAYPANHNKVISVGASSPTAQRKSPTSSDGEYWWGSNYGTAIQDAKEAVDIMAPTILPATDIVGSNGYSTGDYSMWFNGTSCATPYAAGVAGLLLSKVPTLTPAQVRTALVSTATDMTFDSGAGWDRYTGYGMVNANNALNSLVVGMPTCIITSPAIGSLIDINTTVTVNVTASDPDGTITSVRFYIDEVLKHTDNTAPYSWSWDTTGESNGNHTVKAVATDNASNSAVSSISVTLLATASEGFETGNFKAFNWNNSSTTAWLVQSGEKYTGSYAAKSGAIPHSASTTLSLTLNVTSNGSLSFFQKTSSEIGYDFLRFYLDGVEQGSWSGLGEWTYSSYPVSTGSHTFAWTYSKDVSASSGSDCAWLDHIVFPQHVIIYNPPQNLLANAGNNLVNLTWQAPVYGIPTGYKVYKNGTLLTTVSELSYADYAVSNGSTYSYYLKAVFSSGESEATASVEATPALGISEVILGTGTTATTSAVACPININYKSLHGQSVYTKAELNDVNIYGPINITRLGFYINSAPNLSLPNFKIRLKHTSDTDVTNWQAATSMVTVYSSASYLPTAGDYQMLTLSTPFTWNGVDNIVVDTAFSPVSTSSNTGTVRYTTVTSGYRFARADADQTNVFTGTNTSTNRPNLKLTFQQIPTYPGIEVNKTSLAFGYVVVGSSAIQDFTISNPGTGNLFGTITAPTGYSVALQGGKAIEGFTHHNPSMRDAISYSVSAGLSAGFNVTFTPLSGAAYNGNIVITHNAGGADKTISVTGLGVGEIVDHSASITPPDVLDPNSNIISTNIVISNLSAATGYVSVLTGYNSLAAPYDHAGLDFMLSGTSFAGATLSFTHNLGFIPAFLAYKIGDSGSWTALENPGDWTAATAYFTVPNAKGENDLFITFSDSEDHTLPVTLSSFTATVSGTNNVTLTWVTASETGLLGYYLYRSEMQALASAQSVSNIISAGNSSTQQTYQFTDGETLPNTNYFYWLMSLDIDGESAFFGPISVQTNGNPENPNPPAIPAFTELLGNFPNPFNPDTLIRYSLDKPGTAVFQIWNIRGQLVNRFELNHSVAGYHKHVFDGKDFNGKPLSSGVYYYRLTVGKEAFNRKMMLMK